MKSLLESEKKEVLDLPFDQYQRYRLVADLVQQLSDERGELSILDVGGRTGILREFLPRQRIVLVDVEPADTRGLVLGDGARLPFRDDAFDVVTACDTLEHVPPHLREGFVRECARVSRGWVVLAGPYGEPRVDQAEEVLADFLDAKLDLRHRYLEEHRTHGLPDRAEVEALLARTLGNVTSHGHGNLERWLLLMTLSMYMEGNPHLQRVARRYYRFYNQALYPSDDEGDVYRHAVVGHAPGYPAPRFGGSRSRANPPQEDRFEQLNRREEQLNGHGGHLNGRSGHGSSLDALLSTAALAPLQELLYELVPFDREREVFDVERELLLSVNGGLERDLQGHRARLAELERLADERSRVIETLEQDLDGHRARMTELERLADERADVVETLEQDLNGHRESLLALGAEVAALQGELTTRQDRHEQALNEHRAVIDGLHATAEQLERELQVRAAHQAELEAELQRVHELAKTIHEDLLAEHRAAEFLRAELRSRSGNLRRALGLEKPAY